MLNNATIINVDQTTNVNLATETINKALYVNRNQVGQEYAGPSALFIFVGGTGLRVGYPSRKLLKKLFPSVSDKIFSMIVLDSEEDPVKQAHQEATDWQGVDGEELRKYYLRLRIPQDLLWANHPELERILTIDQIQYLKQNRRDVSGFDRNRFLGAIATLLPQNLNNIKDLIVKSISARLDPGANCRIQDPPIVWVVAGSGGGTGSAGGLAVALIVTTLKQQRLIPQETAVNLVAVDPSLTTDNQASAYNAAIMVQEIVAMTRPGYVFRFPDRPDLPEVHGKPFNNVIWLGKTNGSKNLINLNEVAEQFAWIVRVNHDRRSFAEYANQFSNTYARSQEPDLIGNRRSFRGESVLVFGSKTPYLIEAITRQALIKHCLSCLLTVSAEEATVEDIVRSILIDMRMSPLTLRRFFREQFSPVIDRCREQLSRPALSNPNQQADLLLAIREQNERDIITIRDNIVASALGSASDTFNRIVQAVAEKNLFPSDAYEVLNSLVNRMDSFAEAISEQVAEAEATHRSHHQDTTVACDQIRYVIKYFGFFSQEALNKENNNATQWAEADLDSFAEAKALEGVAQIFSRTTPDGQTLATAFRSTCLNNWTNKIAKIEQFQSVVNYSYQQIQTQLLRKESGFIQVLDAPVDSFNLNQKVNNYLATLETNSRWQVAIAQWQNTILTQLEEGVDIGALLVSIQQEATLLAADILNLYVDVEEHLLANPVARQNFLDAVRSSLPFAGEVNMDLLRQLGFLDTSKFTLIMTPKGQQSKLLGLLEQNLRQGEYSRSMFVEGGSSQEIVVVTSLNGIPAYALTDIIAYVQMSKNYRGSSLNQCSGLVPELAEIKFPVAAFTQEMRKLYLKALAWKTILVRPFQTPQGQQSEQFVGNLPKYEGNFLMENVPLTWNSLTELDKEGTNVLSEQLRQYWQKESGTQLASLGAKVAVEKLALLYRCLTALKARSCELDGLIKSLQVAVIDIFVKEFRVEPPTLGLNLPETLWPTDFQ